MSSAYIVKRILRGLLTILLAVVVIFFLMRVAPADPAVVLASEDATEEDIQAIREAWGLDKPYTEQFFLYVRSLITGDAGMSYQFCVDKPLYKVTELVMMRLPNTIKLAFTSIIMSILMAIPIGIVCGLHPGSWIDNLVTSIGFIINAFPNFFIGMILILVFGLKLKLLPTGGNDAGFASILLPAFTLSLHFSVTLTRMTRTQFIQVMRSNFIRTTKAKGLDRAKILYIHGLRNVSIPLTTIIGLRIGAMLGGSIVVETLFRWPGLGYLLMTSVTGGDYPTVQFLVPYVCAVFVVINFIVDMLYGVLDPRAKAEKKA